MESIVLSTSPEGLRCHIGLVIVDSTEDTGMACCSRVGRLGPKPGQPMRELAQPVPYTGGVPGDLGFKERAAYGALSFFCCAGLFAWRIYLRLFGN